MAQTIFAGEPSEPLPAIPTPRNCSWGPIYECKSIWRIFQNGEYFLGPDNTPGVGIARSSEPFPDPELPPPPAYHEQEADPSAASRTKVRPSAELGQLQPFIAVFPQECMGQLASLGPT
jgi:hypothetical protein